MIFDIRSLFINIVPDISNKFCQVVIHGFNCDKDFFKYLYCAILLFKISSI